MHIIFTDKLSKIVAHYENLRVWYLNKVFNIMDNGQDLLAEKTLSVTLNDISSRNEVPASRYLTLKNNKITVEEWRTTRHKTNLENFVLRERLVDKNGWQHYVNQVEECALAIAIATWYLVCSSNWDRVIPKRFCHHNTASSCMHAVNTQNLPYF